MPKEIDLHELLGDENPLYTYDIVWQAPDGPWRAFCVDAPGFSPTGATRLECVQAVLKGFWAHAKEQGWEASEIGLYIVPAPRKLPTSDPSCNDP